MPLNELPLEKWRSLVALVSQRPYIFYGSAEENIRMARPTATQEEVIAAAEMAGAHEFITHTTIGLATATRERGTRLVRTVRHNVLLSHAAFL